MRKLNITTAAAVVSALVVLATFVPLASAQGTAQAAVEDTRVRALLSWLDDAEVLEPGGVQLSLAVSRWNTQAGHEVDAPAVFAAVGVAPRAQVAASFLHYSSSYSDGFTSSGRGDVYLMGKYALISPREHPGGIAISPTLEILNDLSLTYRGAGASRVAWGLPISLQYTGTRARVYGSTGYFSRGSVFGSAGVEVFVATRVIASGSLLYSHATTTTALSDTYGLSRDHTDVTGGLAFLVSPIVSVYGTAGRTVAGTDASSTTAICSFGVSFRFAGRTAASP